METSHVSLNPGGDCVILYWQDVLRKNTLDLQPSAQELQKTTEGSSDNLVPRHNFRQLDPNLTGKNDQSIQSKLNQLGNTDLAPLNDDDNDDADDLENESDDGSATQQDLAAQSLPDAIAKDPFFARLLRNAEQYGEPKTKKKAVKRKARDIEDDYDVLDPFIDDSELTFMDGHAHSRAYTNKKRRVVVGYSNDKPDAEATAQNLQKEEGKVILDLELFDRASTDDFFVYFGELEEFEEQPPEELPAKQTGAPATIMDVEPSKSALKPKIITPDKNVSINAGETSALLAEKRPKASQGQTQASRSPNSIQKQLATSIPTTPELDSFIKALEEQVKTGIIINKGHFPSPLKDPMRNVLITAIKLHLDYEASVLSVYPIPARFSKASIPPSVSSSLLPSLQQTDSAHPFNNSNDLMKEALLENQILAWEPATDLIDVGDIYSVLTKFLPWNLVTLKKIIYKLIGRDLPIWKNKQLDIIENCMKKKIAKIIDQAKDSNSVQITCPSSNTKDPTPDPELKFTWTQSLRHLLYQFVKVYLEPHGVILNPLVNSMTTEERAKQQRLRRDAYQRLIKLWPENLMTTTVLSREYSYKRSTIVTKLRKSLGATSNNSSSPSQLQPIASNTQNIAPKNNSSIRLINSVDLTKPHPNPAGNKDIFMKEKIGSAHTEISAPKRPPGNNLNKKKLYSTPAFTGQLKLKDYQPNSSLPRNSPAMVSAPAPAPAPSSSNNSFQSTPPPTIPIDKSHNTLGLNGEKPTAKKPIDDLIAKSGSSMYPSSSPKPTNR